MAYENTNLVSWDMKTELRGGKVLPSIEVSEVEELDCQARNYRKT